MKAQDWSAKRHLLALSFTMQDELIADLAAAEHDVDELTAAARENEGIIERAKGALARIAEVEREMAQGKLITEDAAATAGRAITRAESAERERKTAIDLFQHEQDRAESAERRVVELRRYVAIRTICPCCEESVKCHRECTYEHDDVDGWKDMMLARAALAAGEGKA